MTVEELTSWARCAGKKVHYDVRDVRDYREEWERSNWEIFYCVISVIDEDSGEETFYRGLPKRTEEEACCAAASVALEHLGVTRWEDEISTSH